eukprot:TRINITY_DN16398_c0_g1_i1.p1 TRINITY_DN16398_c0_g1~~TRINITY_DN16398_c0_g1_i1.p1  ORF type:complete len:560 (+),score=87.92 TRINITY_DN16398_c0_g1_i1:162-1841(+)
MLQQKLAAALALLEVKVPAVLERTAVRRDAPHPLAPLYKDHDSPVARASCLRSLIEDNFPALRDSLLQTYARVVSPECRREIAIAHAQEAIGAGQAYTPLETRIVTGLARAAEAVLARVLASLLDHLNVIALWESENNQCFVDYATFMLGELDETAGSIREILDAASGPIPVTCGTAVPHLPFSHRLLRSLDSVEFPLGQTTPAMVHAHLVRKMDEPQLRLLADACKIIDQSPKVLGLLLKDILQGYLPGCEDAEAILGILQAIVLKLAERQFPSMQLTAARLFALRKTEGPRLATISQVLMLMRNNASLLKDSASLAQLSSRLQTEHALSSERLEHEVTQWCVEVVATGLGAVQSLDQQGVRALGKTIRLIVRDGSVSAQGTALRVIGSCLPHISRTSVVTKAIEEFIEAVRKIPPQHCPAPQLLEKFLTEVQAPPAAWQRAVRSLVMCSRMCHINPHEHRPDERAVVEWLLSAREKNQVTHTMATDLFKMVFIRDHLVHRSVYEVAARVLSSTLSAADVALENIAAYIPRYFPQFAEGTAVMRSAAAALLFASAHLP